MAVTDPHLIPKPRSVSRRGWIIGALVFLGLGLLYVLVAVFYNVEGGTQFDGPPVSADTGVIIEVEPLSVDAQKDTAVIHIAFRAAGDDLLTADQRLAQNTRVLVQSDSGTQEFRYPAGEPLSQQEITVGVDGEQAMYPFDKHAGFLGFQVDTYTKNSDGTFTSTGDVYTSLAPSSNAVGWGINGWDTLMAGLDKPGSAILNLTFTRAFSTQVFALLLLALVVLLAGIAVIVGVLVSTRRRRAEVGLMAYAASLLFALPALRNYMPNSPPIGAAIDIYVYLWVIVASIIAVTLVVTSWIGQTRVNLLAEREHAKEVWAETQAQTGD
jgi:hypothetical protein